MTEAANGNGRFWKKPVFSIEDLYKYAGVIIVALLAAAAAIHKWGGMPEKIDTIQATMATKEQVQEVIDQGNDNTRIVESRLGTVEHRLKIVQSQQLRPVVVYRQKRESEPQWEWEK